MLAYNIIKRTKYYIVLFIIITSINSTSKAELSLSVGTGVTSFASDFVPTVMVRSMLSSFPFVGLELEASLLRNNYTVLISKTLVTNANNETIDDMRKKGSTDKNKFHKKLFNADVFANITTKDLPINFRAGIGYRISPNNSLKESLKESLKALKIKDDQGNNVDVSKIKDNLKTSNMLLQWGVHKRFGNFFIDGTFMYIAYLPDNSNKKDKKEEVSGISLDRNNYLFRVMMGVAF